MKSSLSDNSSLIGQGAWVTCRCPDYPMWWDTAIIVLNHAFYRYSHFLTGNKQEGFLSDNSNERECSYQLLGL